MRRDSAVPVMFRVAKEGQCLAVFPSLPGDCNGRYVQCYAHVGQHSSASMRYVTDETRPATPEEYAALKRELEAAPYEYSLRVVHRQSRRMRQALLATLR